MPVDLYYLEAGAPSRAVMMTAKMVGVELNLKTVDLFSGEHLKPEFLKMNPRHTVPTMDDNGFYMCESRAICAYLVEQYGKDDTLYPKDVKQRAIVDERLYFDMGVLYQRFAMVYYPVTFQGATKIEDKAKKDFHDGLAFLNTYLEGQKYVAGDKMTIADISVLASTSTFEGVDPNVFDEFPNIKRWIDGCKAEIPDYQEVNQNGVDAMKKWIQGALAKLE